MSTEAIVTDQPEVETKVETKAPATAAQHWIFLDFCKAMSVFLIVVMHVTNGAWGQAELGSADWQILNVFLTLARMCIPLFFMQIGAVFLNEKKQVSLKKLYGQFILRIVAAFFFWSLCYNLQYYWLDAPNGFGDFTVKDFISGVLQGAPYSHWFILVSISLYIVLPLFKEIAKSREVCRYALILWGLFTFILPGISKIFLIFPGIPYPVQEWVNIFTTAFLRVQPAMVLGYPGYLLLGYYIHVTEFKRRDINLITALGVLAWAYTIGMTVMASMRAGAPQETFFDFLSLNICLMASAVMLNVKLLLEKRWIKDRTYKLIRFFADVSFGIFLIHDFLRMGLARYGIGTLSFTPIISVPVLAIALYAVTGAIVFWLKNLPGLGAYITGDHVDK